MAGELFERSEFVPADSSSAIPVQPEAIGVPRLRVAQRDQVKMRYASLDQLLPVEHVARVVWELVCGLDLSAWLRQFKAVEGVRGRDGTDPRLLLALWVYATIEGIASARELARRCESHLPFQWLCGEVSVNHRLLGEFRAHSEAQLDQLLTRLVASLLSEGLVTLKHVAQDGMRVRANAGRSSFHKRAWLRDCLAEAGQQVQLLKAQGDESPSRKASVPDEDNDQDDPPQARLRQRLQQALAACDEVESQRHKHRSRHRGEPTASSTDPDARLMKMADGGYRPAYNVQFGTDVESGLIVGVDVINTGSDNGQLRPMVEQLHARYGRVPESWLADGGFASLADVEHLESERNCRLYLPPKDQSQQPDFDRYARQPGDSDAVANWRGRLRDAAAKQIYRLRARSAEWVNAICRNHNLWQLPVRGLKRCRAVTLLHALTHNLLQTVRLRSRLPAS